VMRKDKLEAAQLNMRIRMASGSRLPAYRERIMRKRPGPNRGVPFKKQPYRKLYLCDLPEACRVAARALEHNLFLVKALEEAARRLDHLAEDNTVLVSRWK
jgi:hypothetical protein